MTSTNHEAFWAWFAGVADELREASGYGRLLEELDRRVQAMGVPAWEIGPGRRSGRLLALSPGGDLSWLELTTAIVAAAPAIEGWELYASKPPKGWRPVFSLRDSAGTPVPVDATSWRYVVLEHQDGCLEIVVEVPNLPGQSEEFQRWAAEVALDGLMGEEARLRAFDEVGVVAALEPAWGAGRPLLSVLEAREPADGAVGPS